jgi:hypothetical protein
LIIDIQFIDLGGTIFTEQFRLWKSIEERYGASGFHCWPDSSVSA